MTTYKLLFRKQALKEWEKLDGAIRDQFRKKLEERLREPHIVSARLSGLPGCYKIKLRSAGYRLIYQVDDDRIVIVVVAVGARDSRKDDVYSVVDRRLKDQP